MQLQTALCYSHDMVFITQFSKSNIKHIYIASGSATHPPTHPHTPTPNQTKNSGCVPARLYAIVYIKPFKVVFIFILLRNYFLWNEAAHNKHDQSAIY